VAVNSTLDRLLMDSIIRPRERLLALSGTDAAELFDGKKPAISLVDPAAFKKAQIETRGKQGRLL